MYGNRETDSTLVSQQLDIEELKPVSSYLGKPAVLFSIPDKLSLIENLNYVLIGKFSHGRPSLVDLKAFFAGLKLVGRYNISIFDNKHIYIELESKDDFTRLWLKLVWNIKGFAMRIFKWDSEFSPASESALAPVWIRLEGLTLYLFDVKSLCSIANAIGKPLRVDTLNVNRIRLNSARVCVELNVAKPLIDAIWVGFGEGDSMEGFWVKVFYDVLPHFCSFCEHMGHSLDHCMRKHADPNVIVSKSYSGTSQVWTEVKKKPNDDIDLKCKGKEIAPLVHTVCCSSTAEEAATDLSSSGRRICTSEQSKEEVTYEKVEDQIMEKNQQQDLKRSMNSPGGELNTEWTTVIRKKNKGSKVKQPKSKSYKKMELQSDKIAIEVANVEEQTLTLQMDPYTEEQVVSASADFHQQGNKDGQAPDAQTIEQLHQSTNSDVADQVPDQIGLHLQQDVQVVGQATNQGIVEVAGLHVCSAMIVWEGTTIAEDDKAAAKHSPAPTNSEQMVEVDMQKIPIILATQQEDKDGEDSANQIDKFAEHKGDQPQPKIAVEASPQNADTEGAASQAATQATKTNISLQHFGKGSRLEKADSIDIEQDAHYDRQTQVKVHTDSTIPLKQGEITTLATDPVGLKSEAINALDEDTSTQEWQLVGKKINKTKGVVTRSQTKNANSNGQTK